MGTAYRSREGNKPLRWDRTGQVVERMENRQFMVKMDGSGRVLLRTRAHLRKIKPNVGRSFDMDPGQQIDPEEVPLHIPGAVGAGRVLHPVHGQDDVQQEGGEHIVNPLVRVPVMEPEVPVREQVDVVLPGVEVPVPEVRRSSRVRKEMRNTDYHYY